MPEGVKSIGSSAFAKCANLKKVVLPKGLQEIGSLAFYECPALEEVWIPESVKEIGEHAFSGGFTLKETRLYGAPGSRAETYARENKHKFNVFNFKPR